MLKQGSLVVLQGRDDTVCDCFAQSGRLLRCSMAGGPTVRTANRGTVVGGIVQDGCLGRFF